MASNDFLPFAVGGSANVLSQSAYAALTSILQNGFQSGIAQSVQLNKVWRQSSIMAAVLAQFIADQSGQNSVDDGTTATLEANLLAAIRNASKQTVILADTGAANAYTATNTPALTALPSTGYVQRINIAHANTGASTYAPDGLTAKPIYGLGLQPLQGGELPVGVAVLMYLVQASVNSGNGAWIIIESLGGASQVAPATQSQHAPQFQQVNPGRLLNVQVFNANATYTPTTGMSKAIVKIVGGGAGSGGAPAAASAQVSGSAGSSSGAYALVLLTAAQIGANQSVTIGAAGSAGASGSSTGGNGGQSSFGSIILCPGGIGSSSFGPSGATFVVSAPPSVPIAPTVTLGTLIEQSRGNQGTPAIGGSGGGVVGGNGAASPFEPGVAGAGAGANGPGVSNAGAVTGIAGNAGKVVIYEYA